MYNPYRILNIFKAHFTWKGAISEPTSIDIRVDVRPIVIFNMTDEKGEAQKMIRDGFELYNTKSGLNL